MGKQLGKLFAAGFVLGLILYFFDKSNSVEDSDVIAHVSYIIGSATGCALVMMVISFVIAGIPGIVFWLTNKKSSLDFFRLVWIIWIIFAVGILIQKIKVFL